MRRLLAHCSVWLVLAPLASGAEAQTSDRWQACRQAPTRTCLFAEAIQRVRDDAPSRDIPRYAEWESGLYVRLSAIAEAKKDRALFTEAKRVVSAHAVLQASREAALRTIALAEVRAGFVDDAVRTIDGVGDLGPVPAEIVAALAVSGRLPYALTIAEHTAVPAARAQAWSRLARATRNAAYLEKAAASIRDIGDAYEHGAQSQYLAVAQADLGQIARARRTIRDIGLRAYEALALADIAGLTGNAAFLDEAKRRAAGLNEQPIDQDAWRAIFQTQIAMGRLSDALQSLKRPELETLPGTLADDAGALAAAYWIKSGSKSAEGVLTDILNGYAERFWGPARYALAVGLADAGRFDSALLMAFLSDEPNVDWAVAHIALRMAQAQSIPRALELIDKVKEPGARSPALARIAILLP